MHTSVQMGVRTFGNSKNIKVIDGLNLFSIEGPNLHAY
jgi:hypothetical protein